MEPIRKRVSQLDQVNKALNWLDCAFVKILGAGKVPYVEIGIESGDPKSDIQREKFHAMIGDIKKTGVIVIPGRRIVMNDYDNEQCKALLVMWFTNEVAGTDIAVVSHEHQQRLLKLDQLTPGDFATVLRQADTLGETFTAHDLLTQLEKECLIKKGNKSPNNIGFI